jgi:hypothetical protein
MKKMLLASALVALLSTAHADVGLSGSIRYDLTKADGTAATSGISRSQLNVTSTEDLGGGMSVTGKVGIDGAGRNETVGGTDVSVAVASRAGTVLVGQIELGNGIIDRGYAGAPVMGADGVVLAAKGNADIVKYSAPAVAGFTASVSGTRAVDTTAARAYTLGVAGKVGPLDTGVDYNETTKRVRASASAAVMGLTVGAGVSRNETGVADSYALGASKAFGPVTVGAAYSDGNGTAKEVGAQYSLSKRTAVQVAYRKVEDNTTVANNVATTRVRLQHLF